MRISPTEPAYSLSNRSRAVLILLRRSGLEMDQIDVDSLRDLGDPPFDIKFLDKTMPISDALKALLPDAVMFQEKGIISFRRMGEV